MNNLKKFTLTSRRLSGLFASILENGAMVSLAGRWVNAGDLKASTLSKLQTKEVTRTKLVDGVKTTVSTTMYLTASLADLISGFAWRLCFASFPGLVKISSRLRVVKLFSGYIYRMYKNHGEVMTVKYLKASQLAVQKSIGKDPINSLSELDPSLLHTKLTGFKLPIIIPSRDRKLINGQSHSIIRIWLTLFSVYRVISIPGTLKLATIFNPLAVPVSQLETVNVLFKEFLIQSKASSLFHLGRLYRPVDLLLLETASSTSKVSWTGMFRDPLLLTALGHAEYIKTILTLCKQDNLRMFFELLVELGGEIPQPTAVNLVADDNSFNGASIQDPHGSFLGKLSIKSEAAGKERVFAMVDFWTQQALKPIHDMIFSTLKSLPNDGTFNQGAAVKRASGLSIYYRMSFGYDLSAATDRLPVALQTTLLNYLVPTLGSVWAQTLTTREYVLMLPDYLCREHNIPVDKRDIERLKPNYTEFDTYAVVGDDVVKTKTTKFAHLSRGRVPKSITIDGRLFPVFYTTKGKAFIVLKYTVGQPMGALSSWAMLAMTHHLLVQLAFRTAHNVPLNVPLNRDTWYDDYELLGDDIIIFDPAVAREYLILMEKIGVPINTSKSVCAQNAVTEFAKVTTLNGVDVSAISWKMFMSGNSLMGRANIIFYLLNKGFITKRINPWIERLARPVLHKEGNPVPTYIALWTMLSNRNLITVEQALSALIDGTQRVFKLAGAILMNADVTRMRLAIPGLIVDGFIKALHQSKTAERIWNIEKTWFGIHMWKPLAVFTAKADVNADIELLTKSILQYCRYADLDLLPENPLIMDHGSFYQDGAPTLTGESANLDVNDVVVLYGALFTFILKRAERLVEDIVQNPRQIDSPLPLLVSGRDTLDRYNELLQLPLRAEAKLDADTEVTPPRFVKPTELKLVKLLAKMGNRPLFTTAHSFF